MKVSGLEINDRMIELFFERTGLQGWDLAKRIEDIAFGSATFNDLFGESTKEIELRNKCEKLVEKIDELHGIIKENEEETMYYANAYLVRLGIQRED